MASGAQEAVMAVVGYSCFTAGIYVTSIIVLGLRGLRHTKAVDYLSTHPGKSFLTGLIFFLLPLFTFFWCAHRNPGGVIWTLDLGLTTLVYAIGIGVAGRCLG